MKVGKGVRNDGRASEGLVDYWRVTGDEKALKAASNIRDQLLRDEKNILSSVGYNDMFVGGANQINAITEPCDAIHWMRLNKELFLSSGDPKYLDEMEDTFYNAFLAGVSRDGKWARAGCAATATTSSPSRRSA